MSHEHERIEWRRAVDSMTEMDRVATQIDVRAAMGLCGDREDANE
jgi:hypothetical protein